MPSSLQPRQLPVFISYAGKDHESADPARRWLERLMDHLGPLSLQAALFSDRDLEAGGDWRESIRTSLKAAHVAVLLVGPAYLASRHIRNSELPVLLRQAQDEGLVILPLMVRPCRWAETSFRYPDPERGPESLSLASFRPINERPLSGLFDQEQDEVLISVAQRLQREVRRPKTPLAPTDPAPAHGGAARTPGAKVPAGLGLPAVGERIGKYRIETLLGKGGMGVVYRAVHEELGPVAIKLLYPHLSADPDLSGRFLNEARAAARLQDPGIVRVYDFGQLQSGAAYLVMEHLPGETLGARISRAGGPVPVALRLCGQVASVLAVVHERGIVHRDLKPDNLMVVPDAAMPGGERVKLLDFGIAKVALDLRGPTRTGAMMGTPLYMAPEQYLDASRVTDRADVYSLGVIIYQVLSGRLPLVAQGLPELVAMHVRCERPRPLREVAPAVSAELSALVGRMLEPAAAGRPSMAEVRDRLRPLLEQRAAPVPIAVPRPVPQPGRRRFAMQVTGGAVSVLVVVLGLVGLRGAGGPSAGGADGRTGQGQVGGGRTTVSPPVPAPAPPPRAEEVMIRIPGGSFLMGSKKGDKEAEDDERPAHEVKVGAFAMDMTEVSRGAYRACVQAGVCKEAGLITDAHCNYGKEDRAQHPLNCVDFTQAEAYCRWAGKRLPTEEEWEYAARGREGRKYPWGDAAPSPNRLNACDSECLKLFKGNWGSMFKENDGWATTAPVGSFPDGATPEGLLDMAGNVYEWTATLYCGDYGKKCADPAPRVVRGGSWHSDLPSDVRASLRFGYAPTHRVGLLGFRCARTVSD